MTEDILQNSRVFRSVCEQTAQRLFGASRKIQFDRGQLLFSRGDVADSIYVVIEGEVAIETISEQGRPVRVATLRPGQVIGELAVLDEAARTADARATQPSLLLKIDGAAFLMAVKEDPAFALTIIRNLITRLCETNDQIENISLHTLLIRVALTLSELAKGKSGTDRFIKITQTELADRLSATREKVNIHLQTIQRSGAIVLHRGRIEIVNAERLKQFTENR